VSRFVSGHVLATLALSMTGLLWQPPAVSIDPRFVLLYPLSRCVLPTVSAWAMASLFLSISPRRAFDRRMGCSRTPVMLGMTAALLGIVMTAGLVIALDRARADLAILAASSALSAFVLLCLCRKLKPGACVRCGYDVRASLNYGRCPECGTSIMLG
jgi:4-hydroxybenzoate polyprenyltransferase